MSDLPYGDRCAEQLEDATKKMKPIFEQLGTNLHKLMEEYQSATSEATAASEQAENPNTEEPAPGPTDLSTKANMLTALVRMQRLAADKTTYTTQEALDVAQKFHQGLIDSGWVLDLRARETERATEERLQGVPEDLLGRGVSVQVKVARTLDAYQRKIEELEEVNRRLRDRAKAACDQRDKMHSKLIAARNALA